MAMRPPSSGGTGYPSPTSTPPSKSLPKRGSSATTIQTPATSNAGPYDMDVASEFPFPPQHRDLSTQSRLADMMNDWNVFTPSSSRSSASGPALLSPPDALPLSELIEDTYIQDINNASPVYPQLLTPHKVFQRSDSPAPPAFFAHAHDKQYPFQTPGSAFHSGLATDIALPTPIPTRQASWSALHHDRRASVPNAAGRSPPLPAALATPPSTTLLPVPPLPRTYQSFDSISPRTYLPPLPLVAPQDLFSPIHRLDVAIPTSTPSLFASSVEGNALELDLDDGFRFPAHSASPISHEPAVDPPTFGASFTSSPSSYQFPTLLSPLSHLPKPPAITPASQPETLAGSHLHGRRLDPDFLRRYTLTDELGSGGFGFVCSALQTGFENNAGEEVAVKFIFKSRIGTHDYALTGREEPVESYVLRKCKHKGIIGFRDLYEDDEFFYLVQELHGDPWSASHTLEPIPHLPSASSVPSLAQPSSPMRTPSPRSSEWSGWTPGSASLDVARPRMGRRASHDLFEAVEHSRFTEEQAKGIFRQIVDAVSYLHKRGIYHRDLKDENIVIDRNLHVKIIDFGSAVVENTLLPPRLHDQFRGTMSYAAAEVLNGQPYHAAPADIWAMGIILGVLLTGESPFPNTSYAQVGRMKLKKHVPRGALDLMTRCFHVNPERRATISEVKAHPWLREAKNKRAF